MEMQDVQRHELVIKGTAQIIRTGLVQHGWMWECDRFRNPDGPEASREKAVEAAILEIGARLPD